jgi:hypothetical protein
MTTITWDGKEMAGDKLSCAGGTPTRTTKVFRIDVNGSVYLIGGAGNSGDCQAFIRWARSGFVGDRPKMTDCTMLVVSDGVITRHFSDSENPVEIETSYWAEGSRADYALGVMAHVRWILIPALALTLTW